MVFIDEMFAYDCHMRLYRNGQSILAFNVDSFNTEHTKDVFETIKEKANEVILKHCRQ